MGSKEVRMKTNMEKHAEVVQLPYAIVMFHALVYPGESESSTVANKIVREERRKIMKRGENHTDLAQWPDFITRRVLGAGWETWQRRKS